MPKPLLKTPDRKSEIKTDALSTNQRKQLNKRFTDMQIMAIWVYGNGTILGWL